MNRDEIMQILPHRDDMLLLEEASLGEDGAAHGKYTVRDVWQHRDIARKAKSWKGSVAAHETKVFVVK